MKRPNKFVEKKLKKGKIRIQRYIFYKLWGLNPSVFIICRNILSFYLYVCIPWNLFFTKKEQIPKYVIIINGKKTNCGFGN